MRSSNSRVYLLGDDISEPFESVMQYCCNTLSTSGHAA